MKYFDYAATTPIDEEALRVYKEASLHFFGNSSSLHDCGTNALFVVEQCKETLGEILGVDAKGIYFTSGGTEGNVLSIISMARGAKQRGMHIISSMAEHTSVHSALAFLEKEGFEITKIPFLKNGQIDLQQLESSIRKDTILITIQHVNSEIGTIQPIQDIAKMTENKGILFHTDCVQSFGKLDLKTITPYVDSLTISSHKIYGPKGVGAVYIDPACKWEAVFPLLTHEDGFRGGTLNVPGIASFISAAEQMAKTDNHLEMEWELRTLLKTAIGNEASFFEGDDRSQLPTIVGVALNQMEGQLVMLECNRHGFAISTGSACQAKHEGETKAIQAMGYPIEVAKRFFRISFGKMTTKEEILTLGQLIKEIGQS
ncbi:cysteine desulfurase [Oikeobacillus pervagus]|uniref:Cysteine desulfurase n=1 Tax=Oikeobacillus pervagus TaxID=1325931 RepID=A0AAJ1SXM3_9BACI|nr:IscS subfamily cysteine desulfurase [Oikeobacillus pervagus]MDQ0214570.1 cysteine desulfurase [Oikeobacillus pervagus]